MYQYFKFMEMSMSLNLNVFMLFLIRQKIPFHFSAGRKISPNYLCHNEPNRKFLGNSSRFIPRFQIILARRPVICYTIRNIHFSLTAVSYDPAGLLNSWKQVYIIYLGRGILGCFFYSREQRAKWLLADIWRLPRGSNTPLLCSAASLILCCLQRGL